VITIDYTVSPFTGDIFHDLVADLTPWMRYTCPSDPILVLYRMFIKMKNVFLTTCPNGFSSLLQGIPSGRFVTLLTNFGVSSMVKPLKLTVAWIFEWGLKDIINSSVTSSSYP